MENVTKFLHCRRGLRDTQEINTNTYEKAVKDVTILLQSRHGLRNTQEIYTSTYEGDKLEGNHTRKQARSDQLEQKDDDEDYTIEGLKNGNVYENANEGKQTTSVRSRKRLESESEESVEKPVKNVTKLLKGRPGLRDTQIRNTNTPLSCLQEVQEAVKEETQHQEGCQSDAREPFVE